MTAKLVAIAFLVMAASTVQAQARIVESQPMGANASPRAVSPETAQAATANAELYYQLQTLQQELLDLRGLVEQQAHEIKRLKQQRLDDYVDLDRRISQLSQSGAGGTGAQAPVSPTRPTGGDEPAGLEVTSSADELASYRAAIDLILKKQDFDGGVTALKKYLNQYPTGSYAANAQYWLGQIYLQKNELEQSKEWFGRMIAAYPQHQKAPEAKFKLAKTHHLLGDKQRARTLLQEVADSNSAAADLAKQYLKQNF